MRKIRVPSAAVTATILLMSGCSDGFDVKPIDVSLVRAPRNASDPADVTPAPSDSFQQEGTNSSGQPVEAKQGTQQSTTPLGTPLVVTGANSQSSQEGHLSTASADTVGIKTPTPDALVTPSPTPAPVLTAIPDPTPVPPVVATPDPTPVPPVVATPDPTPVPAASFDSCVSAPGGHSILSYGSLIEGNSTDSAVGVANSAVINQAIAALGAAGGGTLCLPPGRFYFEPADLTVRNPTAILIAVSNLTLQGAGMGGAAQGGTTLATNSKWSLVNGAVVRGFGLSFLGGSTPATTLRNSALRDFELDGGAGHTGNYNWPANTVTGDGWDITHKGIVVGFGKHLDGIKIENVWVHRYRGEVIYYGGANLKKIDLKNIRSEDTNASALNVTGALTVTDSYFGKSYIWLEMGMRGDNLFADFRNNTFVDATAFGLSLTQGDMSALPFTFTNNSMTNCGQYAFLIAGGIAGPLTFSGNHIENCSLASFATVPGATQPGNNNVLIENNTVTTRNKGIAVASINNNVTIRNNSIRYTGTTSAPDSIAFGVTTMTNFDILGNTFENFAPPVWRNLYANGERALFTGNSYTPLKPNSVNVNATSSIADPTSEYLNLNTTVVDLPVGLATVGYRDGQEIFVKAGNKRVRFLTTEPSVVVAADRTVTTTWVQFRYSRSLAKWVEVLP